MLQFSDMNKEIIVLGGGCFWCTEAAYLRLKGVLEVKSGYAGGSTENPTYQEVSMGRTGHAEVVEVAYDTEVISIRQLLSVFFTIHDPTTLNRQGYDVGTQYRSIILYTTEVQKVEIEQYLRELAQSQIWKDPIVTELKQLTKFYTAEADHQKYYELNKESSYCQVVINPKLDKLKKEHADLLK
jgi:peptide-methionine (S)-S-oxide reductase